ncbi:hypothetical protein BU15DRAFT_88041 [Melanogaster broomeanus]|nr:hypothetical protein BU15DRAFT_88041 [Melanogaster broomeanus]
MEMEHYVPDIGPVAVGHLDDSFMILTKNMDETTPADDPPSPVQSDSSDLSYLHIDLSDEESTESVDLGEIPVEQEVSNFLIMAVANGQNDLCLSIPGMYRILDLISERGSSGLVDKIIIAQESLKDFVNGICPGAYASLTKVDFKALDKYQVKPVGIYGSKEEIVRFLSNFGILDDAMAAKLVNSNADLDIAQPMLRSGLYITRISRTPDAAEKMFVIYWPEESTWDDDASPPVCRNRVTFMRYITKICDQVTALISQEDAKSIVWSDPVTDDNFADFDEDEDDTDRLFTFEVAKTKEQEEDVSIIVAEPPPESHMEPGFLKPRLVHGETRQGFMTTRYLPGKRTVKNLDAFKINAFLLQDALKKESLQIAETIGPRALHHLIRLGLSHRFPEEGHIWTKQVTAIKQSSQEQMEALKKTLEDKLTEGKSEMELMMRVAVSNAVFHNYPEEQVRLAECYSSLTTRHPRIAKNLSDELRRANCKNIFNADFRTLKEKISVILHLSRKVENLTQTQISVLVQSVLKESKERFQSTLASVLHEISAPAEASLPPKVTQVETRHAEKMVRDGRNEAALTSDQDFVSDLEKISRNMPTLREAVTAAKDKSQQHLEYIPPGRVQMEDEQSQAKVAADRHIEQGMRDLSVLLIQKINLLSRGSLHTLHLKSVVACGQYNSRGRPPNYEITGTRESLKEPTLLFTIHLMHLTTQDQHELQLNPTAVPNPRFQESYSFQLPLGFSVSHGQLLEGDKLFLVLVDRNANLLLVLDHLNNIESSIGRERGKMLHRDKIGQDFLLAFDESQSMLAVVGCEKLQLHVFVYDVDRGFTASGSTINLNSWYGDGTIIKQACFISGSEELLLVDSQALTRVFSLTTMQFRPATLDLHHVPRGVYSSPDGSCFLAAICDGTTTSVTAYHWSTFGSNEGIPLSIEDWVGEDDLVLTSLVRRNAVYLLKLDLSFQTCGSLVLNITRKVTEFMFKEKDGRGALLGGPAPALRRTTASWTAMLTFGHVFRCFQQSSELPFPLTIAVAARFSSIRPTLLTRLRHLKGHRRSRLATGLAHSLSLQPRSRALIAAFSPDAEWAISMFKVGEWVVDILCLIPIHLALARDNRFVPLKDGVYSPEVEKSLLGAEINRIVDSISFGWYESIFQSYMADKPVRVVSSMGEQSVGKSFALNHLVDTSFAGSAMRTTEGVWMSVTPTNEALIVALDFEGVHSIERSAQEDTLLVLFNTAISNLVLFRNNFALSRDITGPVSTVLDPVANPALFQSTLVIIIKDVVDSDKADIARE